MSSPKPAPATTVQTQKVELPAWVDAGGQENYQLAKTVADQPFMAYTGDRVAGLTDAERAAQGYVAQGQATTTNALGAALGAAQGATGFQGGRVDAPTGYDAVQAGSFLSKDIGQYMDPNIQSIINPALDTIRRQSVLNEQGAADQARALGVNPNQSSRFAVGQAVRQAETARNMGATEAALRGQAFESAAGRAGNDITSALQAALANQAAGITTSGQRISAQTADAAARAAAAGVNLQGGSLAAQAGQIASATGAMNAGTMAGLGATERGVNQQQLDIPYQNFMAQQGEAEKDLNLRLTALGMSPYGKTTSGTTTQTVPTTTNPWMTGIGAAATFLPMFFSDRKVKKNIKPLGKMPGTDLNTYEFEYKKGFGNDNQKHVGFMADDVQKKAPGNVRKVNVNGQSVKAVDYAGAIRDSRDDKGKRRGKYRPRLSTNFMAA